VDVAIDSVLSLLDEEVVDTAVEGEPVELVAATILLWTLALLATKVLSAMLLLPSPLDPALAEFAFGHNVLTPSPSKNIPIRVEGSALVPTH
jgi:hypothetical protein